VLYRDRVIASASRRPQVASTGSGPPWAVALLVASGLIAAAGVRRVVVANRPG
jgi:MYXO-CTERM domain-containing protein